MPTAVTVLAVAQTAQLVMTVAVVGARPRCLGPPAWPGSCEVLSSLRWWSVRSSSSRRLVFGRLPIGRRLVGQAVGSVRTIGAHLRAKP